MTLQEAIVEMKENNVKLKHKYFVDNEHVFYDKVNNCFIFEDGVKATKQELVSFYRNDMFTKDWSIYE
jgi:methionine synthase II (cobalamin-independent)